eukprot:scaffold6572_cov159-Ochromonas_danica.AAC.2
MRKVDSRWDVESWMPLSLLIGITVIISTSEYIVLLLYRPGTSLSQSREIFIGPVFTWTEEVAGDNWIPI